MAAFTMEPLSLVATSLPPDQPHGARAAAATARRTGATLRTPGPWIAGLAFACYTIPWITVVGFLPAWPDDRQPALPGGGEQLRRARLATAVQAMLQLDLFGEA
jgi:hypothetical protein